ncbi:MAG: S9 family peptidase [Crocinitomicaceae bacterium]|nr:S9 family peptidase [Crocinitomicaceae bacterium]
MRNKFLAVFYTIFTAISLFAQNPSFTPETLWELKRLGGGIVCPEEKNILYTLTKFNVNEDVVQTSVIVQQIQTGDHREIGTPATPIKNPKWYANDKLSFVQKTAATTQLFSYDLNTGEKESFGGFSSRNVVDYKWSPRRNYIVTLESVQLPIKNREQYKEFNNANFKIYDDLMYRHWDAWDEGERNQLFVYRLVDGKIQGTPIAVQKNESYHGVMPPFSGLSDVTFSPDEEWLIYATKKMEGIEFATSTNSDLYAFHIMNQTTTNYTTDYKGYDTHPAFDEKGERLAWLSMKRDGFESDKNDIIIRDMKTFQDINLTSDIDLTVSHFIWSKDGKKIYFLAVKEGTYQIFEWDFKKSNLTQLTEGIHNYNSIDLAGKSIIAQRQSMLVPTDLYQVDLKDGQAKQITNVNADLLKDLPKPVVEKRWITTSDNKKMLTWVIYPPNFRESQKYPALLYCQGGPQSAVSQFFSYRWNFRLMASQGYVIIAPNRRGLPGFGQEWNDAISQDWGGQPMRDYLAAVDEVKKEKFIDGERIGAVGASYGGYSVYQLAGIHQGRFKSFISHCGLFNMTSWYGTTEELFFANWELGGPYWRESNRRSYEEFSPHKLVSNWDTPILVIHGGKDFRVPESQGFEAFQAARIKGIKSRLLYFPEENHWVLNAQNAMVWQHEFFKWLKETL